MKRILYFLSFLLLVSVSCSKTSHLSEALVPEQDLDKDPNVGVVVGFDTDDSNVETFNDLHLYFFDENDNLVRNDYYSEVKDVALEKMLMESGVYTIFAIFNTQEDLLDEQTLADLTLPALIEIVNNLYVYDTYPNMATGMVKKTIEDDLTQVIIPVVDQPIKDIITTLTLDLVYPEGALPAYTKSSDIALRAVVEVYYAGTDDRLMRKMLPVNMQDTTVELILTKGTYDLRIWSDYSSNAITDLYYNTTDINNVSVISKENYVGSSQYKDAFAKVQPELVIEGIGNEQRQEVVFYRPFAKYNVVATDVAAYNAMRERKGYPAIEDLIVEVRYEGYLPTAYNMVESELTGADEGYFYRGEVSDLGNGTSLLASDYVLSGIEDSSVSVGVYIYDNTGKLISAVSGNTICYKANHLTTISGAFLTAGNGGIIVDTDWDGDINVGF